MYYGISPALRHVDDVHLLIEAGIPAPKPWVELAARWNAQSEPLPDDTAVAAYAQAILTGAGDPAALRPIALGELAATQTPTVPAQLRNAVEHLVGAKLAELYQPAAEKNYQQAKKLWDTAAALFTDTDRVCGGADRPGDEIVGDTDIVRRAWTDAALVHAPTLERLAPAVLAAATLCGAQPTAPPSIIPILVNTAGCHRRLLHQAWAAQNRTGRWSAVLAAGGTLEAHPNPASLPEYAAPAEPRETWQRVPGGHRRVMVDDAEVEYAELTKAAQR